MPAHRTLTAALVAAATFPLIASATGANQVPVPPPGSGEAGVTAVHADGTRLSIELLCPAFAGDPAAQVACPAGTVTITSRTAIRPRRGDEARKIRIAKAKFEQLAPGARVTLQATTLQAARYELGRKPSLRALVELSGQGPTGYKVQPITIAKAR